MQFQKSTFFHINLLLLIIGTSWLSCNSLEDVGDAQIETSNGEFAIPLFNSTLSLKNVLDNFDENTTISVGSDGLIQLNYTGDILKFDSEDFFDVLVNIVPPVQILDTNFITSYDIPGSIDIDFLDFKKGQMFLAFQNEHTQDVEVDVYINEIVKDGEILHRKFSIDASDGEEAVQHFELVDLTGWRWNALDDQFTVRYEAIKEDNTRDTLSEVFVTLLNLEYSYAEGYLGNDLYLIGRDTIEIEYLEDWTRGDMFFEDPKIYLTAFNSFGFPVDGQFENILIQTQDGAIIPLESEFITNGVYIDYPRLNEVGKTIQTDFSFNQENSNIKEVLGAGPTAIDYRIDGEPNPNMDETIRGFVTDTSQLRVQLEVELPMHVSASDFSVQDTIEVDFSDYMQVNHAEFKLITDNSMPLSVDAQLYFSDAKYRLIDSLLTSVERVVSGAPVDADGNVIESNETTLFIPIESDRLDAILEAKHILLKTIFSTTNDGDMPVKVLSNQDLNVRMGVRFGVE